MLAWYASSPEHGGNPELGYPPPSSPHFRPNMQSPGPPYQGSMGPGMNYSDRPFENQMSSHCQSNSYPSYQPPSPYRPHPVSPPAHTHQFSNHGNHQIHSGVPYSASHQMSPYTSTQGHYGAMNQDMYSTRHSMYSPGSRNMQQVKSAWGDNSSNGSGDMMQSYNHQSPRPPMMSSPPHMPPPPMRSPPHGAMTATPVPPPPPHTHYRQVPVASSPSHSPHPWPQSQIPSPGVLHSPRTTPSPLPTHTRSPVHTQQPFSPPPTAPSPHHPPPSMTPLPPAQKGPSTSPPAVGATPNRQPLCGSPSSQVTTSSDPLQSLQKMVMLDTEAVESPITRANYEIPNNHPSPSMPSRPGSYFSSVEQLAAGEPGSPYPTYYNLDQNRLCTPPRTAMSTPTSSTYSSAPDSTSNSSICGDSQTTVASADSSSVRQLNGEISQSVPEETTNLHDELLVTNGPHPVEPGALESSSHCSSDSEPRALHTLSLQHDDSSADGSTTVLEMGNSESDSLHEKNLEAKKSRKSSRGRRRAASADFSSPTCNVELSGSSDNQLRCKIILSSPGRRNPSREMEINNGQIDVSCDDACVPDQNRYLTSPRLSSPPTRWSKHLSLEDDIDGSFNRDCIPADRSMLTVTTTLKRGIRRRRSCSGPGGIGGPVVALDVQSSIEGYAFRGSRMPRKFSVRGCGRRGGRRKPIGCSDNGTTYREQQNEKLNDVNYFAGMYQNPVDGLNDVGGTNMHLKEEKEDVWQGPLLHVGPSPSDSRLEEGLCKEDDSTTLGNGAARDGPAAEAPDSIPTTNIPNPPLHSTAPKIQENLPVSINQSAQHLKDSCSAMALDVSPSRSFPNGQQDMSGPPGSESPKKKRGRPFGSKNKPKLPGEEKKKKPIKKKRKVDQVAPEVEQQLPKLKKVKTFGGPYVHLVGKKEHPVSITIVNIPPKEEEKDVKYPKQKRQLHLGTSLRKKLGVGHTSTLSPLYDAFTKDKSWVCSLCQKGSHHRGLGDLFGPYFMSEVSEDQNPSSGVNTNPNTPVQNNPSSEGSVVSEADGQHQREGTFSGGDSSTPISAMGRKVRSKRRRSELVEEFFKATMTKKAKQARKPETIPEVTPSSEVSLSPAAPSPAPPECTSGGREFWVHEDCAVWSHGVYLIGQRVHGLEEAIREASDMLCSKCRLSGATLGCLNKGCMEQYHFICSIDRGCELDEENFSLLCPKHKQKKTRSEKLSTAEA